jgi:catechol 2,3-dioxygenase-like lactoylglutathione lyase family enzyme
MYKYFKSILVLIALMVVSPYLPAQTQNEFARTSISIGVVVEDLNKSLDFYTKVIGMMQVRELSIDSEKAKRMGISEGESFDIKFLKLENVENATELKIMSFGKKSTISNQRYIPESNGIRYITIFVKSMKPLLERIRTHSVKTLGETPTMLDETRQIVLMQDPDGNFVEVIGPK